MKSPHQAKASSTPKRVSCSGHLKCAPMTTKRCTPTSKTKPRLYNNQAMG